MQCFRTETKTSQFLNNLVKLLLTGATGFIGTACLRLALEHGHHVGALVVPGEEKKLPRHSDLTCMTGTLAEPPYDEIAAFAPEVCLHTAWVTAPGVYLESPDNDLFLAWSRDFIKGIADRGVEHVMVLGTCIEYQISDKPLSEDSTPVDPATRYAECKNALREYLAACEGRPQSWCWGRVFYPYGVGEHPSRLCSAIINKLRVGESICLKTPSSVKDYIHIDDLAAAVLLCLERRHRGAINLGTGNGVSVGEMAEMIGRLMERPELITHAEPPAIDPQGHVVADSARLRSLGWEPHVSMETGLSRLVTHLTGGYSTLAARIALESASSESPGEKHGHRPMN